MSCIHAYITAYVPARHIAHRSDNHFTSQKATNLPSSNTYTVQQLLYQLYQTQYKHPRNQYVGSITAIYPHCVQIKYHITNEMLCPYLRADIAELFKQNSPVMHSGQTHVSMNLSSLWPSMCSVCRCVHYLAMMSACIEHLVCSAAAELWPVGCDHQSPGNIGPFPHPEACI